MGSTSNPSVAGSVTGSADFESETVATFFPLMKNLPVTVPVGPGCWGPEHSNRRWNVSFGVTFTDPLFSTGLFGSSDLPTSHWPLPRMRNTYLVSGVVPARQF